MSRRFAAKERLVLCVAMGCAAAGAALVADSMQQRPMVTITEADDARAVVVPLGAELVVKLPAQLGTGYGWDVSSVDASVLTLLGKPVVEKLDDATAGQRERQVFTFRALAKGRTALKMKYARPWEKDAKPAKTFSVTVTVAVESDSGPRGQ